jgi:hypothetical protein
MKLPAVLYDGIVVCACALVVLEHVLLMKQVRVPADTQAGKYLQVLSASGCCAGAPACLRMPELAGGH